MGQNFFRDIAIILLAITFMMCSFWGGLFLPFVPGVHAPNFLSSEAEAAVVALAMTAAVWTAGYAYLSLPRLQRLIGGTALLDPRPLRFLYAASYLGGTVAAATLHVAGVSVSDLLSALMVSALLLAIQSVTVYALTKGLR